MRTVTVETYTPWGTTSAIAVALHYRGKKLHDVVGPRSDAAHTLQVVLRWAKAQGFTHYRHFGTTTRSTI